MANKFTIVISATDKATAVVKKFKDKLSQITRPVREVGASFKKFGKELGLDKLAKNFMGIGKFAANAAKKIATVGGALTGIGIASSIAAVADLTRQWAYMGAAVVRNAQVIGIGTTQFQSLSGAAKLFGLDADAMRAGLLSLGTTLEDVLGKRNPEAGMVLDILRVKMKFLKDGSIDTASAFLDIARAISTMKARKGFGLAETRRLAADEFGLGPLLPLIMQGPKGIAQLQSLVIKSGAVQDPDTLQKATQLQQSLAKLSLTITGLTNQLSKQYSSPLTRFIDFLTYSVHKQTAFQQGKVSPDDAFGYIRWDTIFPWLKKSRDTPKSRVSIPLSANLFAKPSVKTGALTESSAQSAIRRMFPGVIITSGLRSPQRNSEVGGVPDSYHLKGEAMDFIRPVGQTIETIRRMLRAAKLPITELLDEGDHIHWAWGDPRNKKSHALPQMARGDSALLSLLNMSAKAATQQIDINFRNAPPGMTVTQKKGSGPKATLKVSYAMPETPSP